MKINTIRKQPTIGEHLEAARKAARHASTPSQTPADVRGQVVSSLENLATAIEKLDQKYSDLRLRLEDLEDAELNRK